MLFSYGVYSNTVSSALKSAFSLAHYFFSTYVCRPRVTKYFTGMIK